jgi:hypothetical protein
VSLERAAWAVTVAAFLITAVILLFTGYQGYAATFGCVALAAAINLR